MEFLPLFFRVKGKLVLVSGDTELAQRKVELLLRAECRVVWHGVSTERFEPFEMNSQMLVKTTSLTANEGQTFILAVAANEDSELDHQVLDFAHRLNLPLNVANQPEQSDFVFPSIIDRSPVIAAVSSSGQFPILTRLLRSRVEASIPHGYGRLAELSKSFKTLVREALPGRNARRRFWERELEGRFAELVFSGDEARANKHLNSALKSFVENDTGSEGEVYLVGAGPGDPDLLSFKALRLIRQADVVLYDRLVSKEIMNLVPHDAECINVGKERSNHTVPQDSINDLLVKHAKQGKRVLRLKGGDPFIFGRGGEEIDRLAEHKVAFQVVPGITAAAGCAAYAGIPLTHRDYSQSVRFITGHLKNDTCDLAWHEFVHPHQTLVFYMGLNSLGVICSSLIKHGMSTEMPVALVSKGTTREQRVVTGTVETIAEKAKAAGVRAPTIIIVGEVVSLRERLNWQGE